MKPTNAPREILIPTKCPTLPAWGAEQTEFMRELQRVYVETNAGAVFSAGKKE